MEFGRKLQEERNRHGFSQEQLASKLHIARQSVSKWERNEGYPSIGMLLQLSDLFGISVDELLKSDDHLKKSVVKEGEKVKHPYVKLFFDWLIITGLILIVIKLSIIVPVKLNLADWDVNFMHGWLLSFAPLVMMVIGAIGSDLSKKSAKQ